MVRKKERLSREEFNRFFSMGKRYHHEHMTMVFQQNPTFHCAVVVSKKIARHAVDRNRARRRVYEVLRRRKQTDGALYGVYIVLLKASALKLPYEILKRTLLELVTKTQKVR